MPDLLRPDPPRTVADRARDLLVVVSPARMVIGVVGVLGLVGVLWWLVHPAAPPVEAGLPRADTAPAGSMPAASSTGPAPSGSADPAVDATVVVQVAGAVVRPGVYHLPAGSRVVDLLGAAGGAADGGDPDALSLAAVLADGQRVQVPRHGETLPPGVLGEPPPAAGTSVSPGPVDLNTSTVEQLDALPGVGPATAAAIVAHRNDHGPFASVDDLLNVRGIGPAKLEGLRDLVVV